MEFNIWDHHKKNQYLLRDSSFFMGMTEPKKIYSFYFFIKPAIKLCRNSEAHLDA